MKLIFGGIITAVSGFLGGMDGIMYALLAFISIDYITGVAVAIKQKKLSSEVGFWGLVRKVCIIALVGVAHFVDVYVMHTGDIFRTAIALYYIGNEGVSLLENMGNLGVPLSKKLKDVLEQLKSNNDKENN
ncbi:MAG: phage holin family protein [Oscillospiraceae bacterium]|nr:phage holin family protein [Oscillospiraceae bacterium]